jgi:hypothetical protein
MIRSAIACPAERFHRVLPGHKFRQQTAANNWEPGDNIACVAGPAPHDEASLWWGLAERRRSTKATAVLREFTGSRASGYSQALSSSSRSSAGRYPGCPRSSGAFPAARTAAQFG